MRRLLKAQDYRIRAAAVEALRYHLGQFDDRLSLLRAAAADPHPRVPAGSGGRIDLAGR